MVRIVTPCRLHFGLIDLNGSLGRVDGGVGVALNEPTVRLKVERSEQDRVLGDPSISEELMGLMGRIRSYFRLDGHFEITIERMIPRHVGLGATTQLYLAVARALTELSGLEIPVRELAISVARGGTSGIGVAAFEFGGFILDFGHTFGARGQKQNFMPSSHSRAHPPRYIRFPLPDDWYFVCAIPAAEHIHGSREVSIFQTFCPIARSDVERLCHLLLMKLIPSVLEEDIESFGEGLNQMQTLGFKRIELELQNEVVRNLIAALKEEAFGAGLSSFGPTVYALARGKEHAHELSELAQAFCETVIISSVNKNGARVTAE